MWRLGDACWDSRREQPDSHGTRAPGCQGGPLRPYPASVTAVVDPSAGPPPAQPTELAGSPEVSGGVHFPALDGYRAIAATMVVLTHVATSTGAVSAGVLGMVLGRFDFGVPLFFVMSGFLLYRPWVRAALEGRPSPRISRYAVRRFGRIMPLYVVVVVATLTLLPEIQPVPASQWVIHLLGLQIYSFGPLEGLTQTWSLCTEISFYVALPVIGALALGRRRRSTDSALRRQVWVLGGMAVVALVWNIALQTSGRFPYVASFWLPGFLDWFAAGMALAVIDVRRRLPNPGRVVSFLAWFGREQVTCLIMACAVFAIAVTPIAGAYTFAPNTPWQNLIKHLLYLVAAVLFVAPGVLGDTSRGFGRVLSSPVPYALGLISYGIFLWHLPILRGVMDLLDLPYFGGRFWLVAFLVLVATLAVSALTYWLVERPAQRAAHRV